MDMCKFTLTQDKKRIETVYPLYALNLIDLKRLPGAAKAHAYARSYYTTISLRCQSPGYSPLGLWRVLGHSVLFLFLKKAKTGSFVTTSKPPYTAIHGRAITAMPRIPPGAMWDIPTPTAAITAPKTE